MWFLSVLLGQVAQAQWSLLGIIDGKQFSRHHIFWFKSRLWLGLSRTFAFLLLNHFGVAWPMCSGPLPNWKVNFHSRHLADWADSNKLDKAQPCDLIVPVAEQGRGLAAAVLDINFSHWPPALLPSELYLHRMFSCSAAHLDWQLHHSRSHSMLTVTFSPLSRVTFHLQYAVMFCLRFFGSWVTPRSWLNLN